MNLAETLATSIRPTAAVAGHPEVQDVRLGESSRMYRNSADELAKHCALLLATN